MKNTIYKFSLLLMAALMVTSCEDNDIPIFDVENGRAIAGFNGQDSQSIIFNPADDTESTITVGVSTLSDTDRQVNISISENSTLDPQFYSISDLNPVIPAGEFTTDITITTLGGEDLPGASDELILELESVEGAEILPGSVEELAIGLDVQCPSVDLSQVPGNYRVTALTFFGFFEETQETREVIAGPGDNQFTIVEGAYPGTGGEELIFTVDPESGSVTAIDESKLAMSNDAFGPNPFDFQPGGRVLTCVGIIEINFDFGGAIAGNPNNFVLVKE